MSVAYFALRVRAVALLGSVPMANEVRPWVPQQPVWGALRTTWPALIAKMRSLSCPSSGRWMPWAHRRRLCGASAESSERSKEAKSTNLGVSRAGDVQVGQQI
eukprot:gnl/TRDRNA2_/TRDRNA2_164890_c0_seq3.p2 gnl/TRDRNA2_/TRDRNA2_164890_c0~~gnl/TRDRNA2_/TRDRNA2_164890_c0_seq3.p2  ORF type:complete len:103 (+),score=11.27 gnl/TRDRNA2_/TRDRNA2_164890_c0_seq3:26-334(+)